MDETPAGPPQRKHTGPIVAAIIAALVVGAAVTWNQVRHRFIPKNFGVVEQGQIYRSGQISPSVIKKTLVSNHVRVVVDLTGRIPDDANQKAEVEACRELGVEHLNFPLRGDGTGSVDHYVDAIEAMHRAVAGGKPVLVHCVAGAQRTGGVIAAYRLLVQRKSADAVQAEMLQYGWNPGDAPVIDYVNGHIAEIAAKLVERKVIERVPTPLPQIPALRRP